LPYRWWWTSGWEKIGSRHINARSNIGAVLLAAGAGERIGWRPKCLLELDGVPLIHRQITALSGAGVDELVVVLGHYVQQILPIIETFPITIVRNDRPQDGLVSSQRLGLTALSAQLDAVIVALADQPLIDVDDIRALISTWKKRREGIAVVYPEIQGERGNPVIFDATVREDILGSAATIGCRQWQSAHADRVMPFITDNRHYQIDIDTDDDLARFEQDTGYALRWPQTL